MMTVTQVLQFASAHIMTGHGMMPCSQSHPEWHWRCVLQVPVHRYSVYNFYGFRGENPGEEDPEQADYTGYRGPMKCLQLRVRTGVQQAPGALDVRLKVEGVDANQRLVLDGSSVSAGGGQRLPGDAVMS